MKKISAHRLHAGSVVAGVLAGAWRECPPASVISSEELGGVVPLLIGYGTAALAWSRVSRQPALRATPPATRLQDVYRFQALEAVKKETALCAVTDLLGGAGLEPMVFKGWAVAQYYAQPHVRPFGDIDICAPPGRHAEAVAVLRQHAVPGRESPRHEITQDLGLFVLDGGGTAGTTWHVDLHASLDKFRLAPLDVLYGRARRIRLGRHTIRVPAAEDHLRLLAIHFLIHGGFRPLWLCDVAALLESAPEDFDWNICLGEDPRIAHWVACVFELAHLLLGACLDRVPQACSVDAVPSWLMRTVLQEWQIPFNSRVRQPLSRWAGRPWIIPAQLKLRWPNPIFATVAFGRQFRQNPSVRYQWAQLWTEIGSNMARHFDPRKGE